MESCQWPQDGRGDGAKQFENESSKELSGQDGDTTRMQLLRPVSYGETSITDGFEAPQFGAGARSRLRREIMNAASRLGAGHAHPVFRRIESSFAEWSLPCRSLACVR